MCYFVTLLPLVDAAANFEDTGTASRPTSKCKGEPYFFYIILQG